MNIKYEDFLGIYENVFPLEFCHHIISEYDRLENFGVSTNRKNYENAPAHIKDDNFIFGINFLNHSVLKFEDRPVVDYFFDGLQYCFDSYTDKFSELKNYSLKTTDFKVQKTNPGGGYHIWHSERNVVCNRVLVFIFYLNSLSENDGGETEFLYQRKRFSPKENTMLIWPADFTYTHRGNLVLGDMDKYIVTGWFYQA